MNDWKTIPTEDVIQKTAEALTKNGYTAVVVETAKDAKHKALLMISEGAEVFTMTSVTLDTISLSKEINESGKYKAVRPKLLAMDRDTQASEMQKLGATPDYAIGSVHAVTQEGSLLVASQTGSQLPAYVYGAAHVIWVIGAQKIVKNTSEGMKRIYDYVLPLESERANKAYHITSGSFVSKLLIMNREINPTRAHVILVKETLGF